MFTYDSPEEEGKLKGILQAHTHTHERIYFSLASSQYSIRSKPFTKNSNLLIHITNNSLTLKT
jgi:hypothetical protein